MKKNKSTWLSIIKEAMANLGGQAKYSDLYEEIEANYPQKIINLADYKAQIRGVIESHSSDSEVFLKKKRGKEKDIFYMVSEKGNGHWGLRDFNPSENSVDVTEDDFGFPEGKKKLRKHICRERNQKVIQKAKKKRKKEEGKLICEVCGFDFEKTYGEIGIDFIEGHHIIPVSSLCDNDKTKVSDIVLVCSNCHKMLHRKRPWLSHKDLKKLLRM